MTSKHQTKCMQCNCITYIPIAASSAVKRKYEHRITSTKAHIQGVTVAGLEYWTHPKWSKMPIPALYSVGEKLNHVYSAYFLAKFAPLVC